MRRPVILRPEAEVDVRTARDELEAARVGLGKQFTTRVREVLSRLEAMPELYGEVWRDVRAARLRQFRHVIYYVVLADRVEVLAVIHGSRDATTWQSRR